MENHRVITSAAGITGLILLYPTKTVTWVKYAANDIKTILTCLRDV